MMKLNLDSIMLAATSYRGIYWKRGAFSRVVLSFFYLPGLVKIFTGYSISDGIIQKLFDNFFILWVEFPFTVR